MKINHELSAMARNSRNGYETCFCYHQDSAASYHWELIRYPLDINRLDEPSEVIKEYHGRFDWQDAINHAKTYLADHPDDGFAI